MEAIKVFSHAILEGPNPFSVIRIDKFESDDTLGFSRVEAIKKLINKEDWIRNMNQLHVMIYPGKYIHREEFNLFTEEEIESVSIPCAEGHNDMILGVCLVDNMKTKRVLRINSLNIFLSGHNFEELMFKLVYEFYNNKKKLPLYMIPIKPKNIQTWKVLELKHFRRKHLQRFITNMGFSNFCDEFLWSKDDLIEYLNSNPSKDVSMKIKRKYNRSSKVLESKKKRKYTRRSEQKVKSELSKKKKVEEEEIEEEENQDEIEEEEVEEEFTKNKNEDDEYEAEDEEEEEKPMVIIQNNEEEMGTRKKRKYTRRSNVKKEVEKPKKRKYTRRKQATKDEIELQDNELEEGQIVENIDQGEAVHQFEDLVLDQFDIDTTVLEKMDEFWSSNEELC